MYRTFCTRCQTFRFKEADELCYHCARGSKVEASGGEDSPPEQPEPIVFGGHEITAPGFTQDRFERGMVRALVDELEIHAVDGGHVVTHRGQNGGYFCSRHTCSCKAGEHGQACKHRAMLCLHLDVRDPAIRRQWQAAERSVSRSAVAA